MFVICERHHQKTIIILMVMYRFYVRMSRWVSYLSGPCFGSVRLLASVVGSDTSWPGFAIMTYNLHSPRLDVFLQKNMKFVIVLFKICNCLIFVCLPGLVLGVTEYIFSVHTFCCCKVFILWFKVHGH